MVLVIITAFIALVKLVLFLKPKKGNVKWKQFFSTSLQDQHNDMKTYILFANGFRRYNLTSTIHGKGKKLLMKSTDSENVARMC